MLKPTHQRGVQALYGKYMINEFVVLLRTKLLSPVKGCTYNIHV